MSTNVYNIVWADDDIDNLLDDYAMQDLIRNNFNVVGTAHNGQELERILNEYEKIDAVITDANFNETDNKIVSERDTSGLDYARSLYIHKLNRKIPFFLFTARSEELLKEIYELNPGFLQEFPRYKRWFSKTISHEYNEMLDEIKKTVDEIHSTGFIIRNKYREELSAASIDDATYKFIFDFLVRDYEGRALEINEPFSSIRKAIERIFGNLEKLKLIPPISDNTNGTAAYFAHENYSIKNENTQHYVKVYEMLEKELMPKPIASSLNYIVNITQDAAHSKEGLKLKVDEYFQKCGDLLLLRSSVHLLMDIQKWFVKTALNYRDPDWNEVTLWQKIKDE